MSGVPSNIVVPYFGIDFDNSKAATGSALLSYQALLFGQKTSEGSGEVGELIRVYDADTVGKLAGWGSQPHMEAITWFKNNASTDTFIYLLEDASGGTKAAFTLTVTTTTVLSGEIDLYIGGRRIAISVSDDDTDDEIATAIATAINENLFYLSIGTATTTDNVVSFSAKNAGTVANSLDVRFSYYDGESMPSGVSVAFAVVTAGTVDPSVETMLSGIGDEWFNIFVGPYSDAPNVKLLQTELLDRNSSIRQIDGVYFCAKKDTNANLISFSTASGMNCQFVCLIGCYNFPTSEEQIAAAYAGVCAQSAADDPAIPLHRQTLSGVLVPKKTERLTLLQRNALALKGISTVSTSNGAQTDATVTMYLKNSAGASDDSYKQMNNIFILMYLRYSFRNWILTRYARAKLCDNADNVGANQQIITPKIGQGEALAWFRDMEEKGLVENYDTFKSVMTCLRDTTNTNRLNWNLTPDLMNQFIVGSATVQFVN